MSSTQKNRARGLFTPKEFAAVDSIAFSPAALQAAFLLRHEACRAFYDRRSAAIRGAKDMAELRSAVAATRKEGTLYTRIAESLLGQESSAKQRARRSEAELRAKAGILSQEAGASGQPAPMFERRSGQWVAPGFFAPVPFVDGPSGQDFTHTVLA